jgi:hypothetical protein
LPRRLNILTIRASAGRGVELIGSLCDRAFEAVLAGERQLRKERWAVSLRRFRMLVVWLKPYW